MNHERDKVLRDLAASYIESYYHDGYTRWDLYDMNTRGDLPSATQLSVSQHEMLRVIEHIVAMTGDTQWGDNRDD